MAQCVRRHPFSNSGHARNTTPASRPARRSASVAGWGLHPLESAAFARRTPNADFGFAGVAVQTSTVRQLRVQFLDSLIRRNGSVFFGAAIICRNKSQDLPSLLSRGRLNRRYISAPTPRLPLKGNDLVVRCFANSPFRLLRTNLKLAISVVRGRSASSICWRPHPAKISRRECDGGA